MSPRSGARISVDGKFFRRGHDRWLVKGISYGPFNKVLEASPDVEQDLLRIKESHFNALRVYEVPRLSFFERCSDLGIDVFVSLPWEMNTDFLRLPILRQDVLDKVMRHVEGLSQAPALAGYFVANEIPTTLVRWMGVHRVNEFLEELLANVRSVDPDRVLAYANYPSTEYLLPRNADFVAFNIFLENREPFRQYLRRLHHLADGLPLVVSEYGLDSQRNGEEAQAEALSWLTSETYAAGVAGAFLFAYTDEWFNGGRQMEDWSFGLVRSDRSEKPSSVEVRRQMAFMRLPAVKLDHEPLVSVIVCTHNGHSTLAQCLVSLQNLTYGNYEVLVVDDGSKPGIDKIVATYEGVRYVRQNHAGLSVARNRGASYSHGEVIVFTDDDCEADADWLTYLMFLLQDDQYQACGGPNLPPPTENITRRCIQLAPGNPSHVLLNDVKAEHLPGCNLAVKREAFDRIGGFREHYRVAGDDVDFCWRLQREGYELGFSPCAFVWHHRRRNVWSFLRQQIGYGKSEALLENDHPHKFAPIGGAHWKGIVYEPLSARLPLPPVIYHGEYGQAPFQAIYQSRAQKHSWFRCLTLSFYWLTWIGVFVILGWSHPFWWGLAGAMVLLSFTVALCCAWSVCLPEVGNRFRARLTLAILFWLPSVGRGAARWIKGGYRYDSRPLVRSFAAYRSEDGVARESLLKHLVERQKDLMKAMPARASTDWATWDLLLSTNWLTQFRLTTVTEIHDRQERVTRISVQGHLRPLVKPVMIAGALVIYVMATQGQWWELLVTFLLIAGMSWGLYYDCRRRLKKHLSRVGRAAEEVGLKLVEDGDDEEGDITPQKDANGRV